MMREIELFPSMDINGIEVAEMDRDFAMDFLRRAVFGERQTRVAFLNANNSNLATGDFRYRQALGDCTILSDGVGVDLAAKFLHGRPFPANLNGTDLIPAMLAFIDKPLRVALVGGRPIVLKKARQAFSTLAPVHEFMAVTDGFFGVDDTGTVLQKLAAARADIVLVAMGSPLQELWIHDNIRAEHGRLIIGVGALFDFVAGVVPRAPEWTRRIRCEWVFRLLLEPKRLWRRYILGNPRFVFNTVLYKYAGRRRPCGTAAADST